ncbi:acetyl-CoA hydrolase/transferase family protein [Intrasporangium sp.]|uniref:acetyl-CoA hydrolase/transferase family protein n=1 Tax=Intrasporangium sp. TaxID=1925024 RepID=UPI00293A81E8|nr:acetyl-CoA hydrolase/transferase C-terminal domain-containing protein [Intrasporangium sp.]MDV3220142.1 acetyl-CoA hydrolase [Intrasporangium sp.]
MQTVSVEELSSRVQSLPPNPRIVASGNMAIPWVGVRVLDEALPSYILHALNAPPGLPEREGVTVETCFVGAGMRRHPALRYVPSRLSLVPLLYSRTLLPDAVLIHCAPPRDGQLSLGVEVNVLPAAIDACRARGGLVIAVINDRMPYTFGDAQVPLDHVDVAIEVDEPLVTHSAGTPDEDSATIGERVASMVLDGSTMQLGIGAVPDATLNAITGRKGIRVWTEMFSDGILALDAAGALDRDHPLVASFVFGSQDLYDWVDGNAWVRMLRTEKTNDPGLIAQQRRMTSVNTALEVDLFGQANASRINARIHSGFGGQTDFIVGALHSPGGQSFIALRSWHPKADVSTIVPLVDEPVTSFQQSAIVTENGVASLWGHDEREQCRDLIDECAHPRVREELWEEAAALGLA